jgi:hypothetical protein
MELSDTEFEGCLDIVRDMWESGSDTTDIASACGITEAQAAHVVLCIVEADAAYRYDEQRDHADCGLKEYFGSDDWADVLIFGKRRGAKKSAKRKAYENRRRLADSRQAEKRESSK